MTYTTADARQQLLDTLAEAIEEIASGLASLGEVYEHLDEQKADKLEQELFRPVQKAYGSAKRTHAEFARRHGLPERPFEPAAPGAPSLGVKGFLSSAVEAVGKADGALATLQDSIGRLWWWTRVRSSDLAGVLGCCRWAPRERSSWISVDSWRSRHSWQRVPAPAQGLASPRRR